MNKITEFQIASDFYIFIVKEAEKVWPTIYQELKNFGEKFVVEDEKMAPLYLALAGIVESLEAVKNVFPKDQAQRIEKWILMSINSNFNISDKNNLNLNIGSPEQINTCNKFNEYAIEEIREYKHYIEEVKTTGTDPDYLFVTSSRLLQILLGKNIKNFVSHDGIINTILATCFGYELTVFVSSWNWKRLKDNYEIIEGDISYDDYTKQMKEFGIYKNTSSN